MVAGELYLADDPELEAMAVRSAELQARYNGLPPAASDERWRVLSELLGEVGEGTVIRPPFSCDYGSFIRIGARSFANVGLVALDVAPITIGDDAQIGPNVQLLTPTHPLDPELRRAKWESADPITIGSNVWLGGGAIVLGGVTIGDDSVVGAGAVVTRDVPAGVVAVGNPARVVRSLSRTTGGGRTP
jgi:maltose O-acetyltransferase